LLSIGLAVVLSWFFKVLGQFVRRLNFSFDHQFDYIISASLYRIRWWFLAPWIYSQLVHYLHDPLIRGERVLHKVLVISTIAQVGLLGLFFLKSWNQSMIEKQKEKDPSSVATLGLLSKLIQTILVVLLILFALDNLGVDVKALIAGLGIGGIAVALAAQNILGDLLASVSIILDKPFLVGDFIIVDTYRGTVEHIGIKTTRVRSISGEELIFSNKNLLESRIHNFKRMWRRRMIHKIGVLYSTAPDVLKQIPFWIETIIKKHEKVEFDRAHLIGFGDSSIDFEFVYYVSDIDYNVALQINESILLEILAKFNQEGVSFAFPTRTLHIESSMSNKAVT
jgi:small-conductance mechanosensitive channel